MSEDIIFTPLQFRNLTVKNRIFRSNISGKFDNEDGSLTQTRVNWECKFAAGGVGAIISSYVPVMIEGRIIAMVVMVFGIGFLSVLTATVASRFVKTERGDETEEILAALARLEAELADLKQHVAPVLGRESGNQG